MTQGRAGTFIVALLLIGASGLLWAAGTRDARLAEAQRSLVTLQFARAAREASAPHEPGLLGRRVPGAADATEQIRAVRAAAGYIGSTALDDAAQDDAARVDVARDDAARDDAARDDTGAGGDAFLAANRTFRAAFASFGDTADAAPAGESALTAARRIARLDRAIGQYAELLRANPGHADAAYNYELAIRFRAAIARAAAAGASPNARASDSVAPTASSSPLASSTSASAAASSSASASAPKPASSSSSSSALRDSGGAGGTAPRGWSLHGYEGAPPAGAEGKSFKLIVPMRPDERQEAERAGKSGPRQRKG